MKLPKRFVSITATKLVVGDPDLTDEQRDAIREQETMRICPCCLGKGMVTHVEATKWEKKQTAETPPDDEPEAA